MNILVTSTCNRHCPYCFAAARISYAGSESGAAPEQAPRTISRELFRTALEFARRGGIPVIGLLGGEPSVHPDFVGLIEDVIRRGLEAKVFTNGIWRERDVEEVRRKTADDPAFKVHLVVNTNHPKITPQPERQAQERLFRALGSRCSLSYNIYEPDPDMSFLVDLIREYGLVHNIRLGLAMPLAHHENSHLLVDQYRRVAPHVLALAKHADRHDVTLGFDCGFTLCMFTPEELGELQLCGSPVRATCGPAVDVGTDLSVWACFPLATLSRGVKLTDFADLRALVLHFEQRFERLYRTGAVDACLDCRLLRRQQCSGGCAAHVYRRLAPTSPEVKK